MFKFLLHNSKQNLAIVSALLWVGLFFISCFVFNHLPLNSKGIDTREIEKSKGFTLVNVISYVPHAIDSKMVVKKPTGNISVVAVDTDAGYDRKISPYDTLVQIIDGRAEFMIDGKSNVLETGEAIVIPTHSTNAIKANEQFKMISIIIKSGYE